MSVLLAKRALAGAAKAGAPNTANLPRRAASAFEERGRCFYFHMPEILAACAHGRERPFPHDPHGRLPEIEERLQMRDGWSLRPGTIRIPASRVQAPVLRLAV